MGKGKKRVKGAVRGKTVVSSSTTKKVLSKKKKSIKLPAVSGSESAENKRKVKSGYRITSKRKVYWAVQRGLSRYMKAEGIKAGGVGNFQVLAGNIHREVLRKWDFENRGLRGFRRFADDNMGALYRKVSGAEKELVESVTGRVERIGIAKSLHFFDVELEFKKPLYSNMTIVFNSFEDAYLDFVMMEFANGASFADWFARNVKPHCRTYYNSSPVAVLSFIGYDEKDNYAEYELLVGSDVLADVGGKVEIEVPKVDGDGKPAVVTVPGVGVGTGDRVRELELEVELERERQKTLGDLLKGGFSPEQVLEFLRLTKGGK